MSTNLTHNLINSTPQLSEFTYLPCEQVELIQLKNLALDNVGIFDLQCNDFIDIQQQELIFGDLELTDELTNTSDGFVLKFLKQICECVKDIFKNTKASNTKENENPFAAVFENEDISKENVFLYYAA